jgi:DNA-directed RNA polymerase specialized sigma24 family protein
MQENTEELFFDDSESRPQAVKRKRGRPTKENSKKGARGDYFRSVENHIMDYLRSTDMEEREAIFRRDLYQPMYDMVSTIYRILKFHRGLIFEENSDEDIINDTFSDLVSKLDKFDHTRNFKAYSYYQTIIKNYLLMKAVNRSKKISKEISTDSYTSQTGKTDFPYITQDEPAFDEENTSFAGQMISETIRSINLLLADPVKNCLTRDDVKVGYALVNILSNWDTLFSHIDMRTQKFNKRSIIVFIQESTFLPLKNIKESIKKYKTVYFTTKNSVL